MEMPWWFSNLVFWSVQVALLVLAAAVLARALKLRQPRILLAYWRSLLAISLLLPVVEPWHGAQNFAATVVSTDFAAVPLPPPSRPTATHWHFPGLWSIALSLGVAVLAGIVLRFAALVLGLLKLRRLRQASSPIPSFSESAVVLQAVRTLVAAPAQFRLSRQVDSPVTFGFLAPVVLLPETFVSLDARFQSAIACHELLHVRRRDWAQHVGEEILRALFWFHPAITWLISRVRLAREQVVDLEVVALTKARKPYLEALLEFTRRRASLAAIPAPPFLAEHQLIERVSLMLKEVRMSRRRLIVSLSLISCCLALVAALAARTFPLKAAPFAAKSVPRGPGSRQQKNPIPPAAKLLRIVYIPHNFDDAALNQTVWDAIDARVKQLPDRPEVETPYDPAKVNAVKKALEGFWSERGVAVEVRTRLTPYARSPLYVVLQFDMYKQTVLPGKPQGGVSGGVAGGIAQGISNGMANGISKGIVNVVGAGVSQGVSRGVDDGIANRTADGIPAGVSGPVGPQRSSDEPSVDISSIWTFTAKRGPMLRQVRSLGTLFRAEGSETSVVKATLPAVQAADVRPDQDVTVDTHKGLVKGHVTTVNPASSGETSTVNIALDAPLPAGFWVARGAGNVVEVDTTIDIERLDNVLYIGRPVNGRQNSAISLFKITDNGAAAVRTTVKLGRASVSTVEVLDGLNEGDRVILSDMSAVANAERIRLTDEKHLSAH